MYPLRRILFTVLALMFMCAPVTAEAPPKYFLHPESTAPEAAAPPAGPGVVVIEAKKYRLSYPLTSARVIPVTELAARVDSAFTRVEKNLGPFTSRIEMIVPHRIVPDDPDFPKELSIAGVCWKEDDGRIFVAVSLGSADVDTFAHELFHARMRELNRSPPTWFEEGMAHFMESEDGFNKELFSLLKEKGPMKLKEIRKVKGVTKEELRMRASAWAMVYYLVRIEGYTLDEVSRMDPFSTVRPCAAWKYVKRSLLAKALRG